MLNQGFLGMSDREFWGDPKGTGRAREQMIAAGYEGIALDGPREIPTQATEWPLVACERCPTHEGPEARLESLAALVAIDPDTDQMWVGRAYPARVFDTSKRPQKPALEPDDEDDEDDDWDDDPEAFEVEDDGAPDMLTDDDLSPEELATAAGEEVPDGATEEPVLEVRYFMPHRLDLQQLELPRRFGRYVAYMVFLDKVSNPVRLSVGKPPDAYKDPAVEAYLASHRDALPPPEVSPPIGPEFLYGEQAAQAGAPEPPGSAGVVLEVDASIDRADPALVRGAFRLPVHPHLTTGRPGQPDVGFPGATAVIPLTLLFTGPTTGDPMVVALQVPTTDALQGEAPLASGRFVINARATGQLHNLPVQPYHVHAFAGGEHRASASFEVSEAS